MMQIVEKNQGPKIAYEESGTRLFFGDDELMLNVAKYQRDWAVQVDICRNRDAQLVIGTGEGLYYVAQVDIPAIQYESLPEGAGQGDEPQALPLAMEDGTLTLWSLNHFVLAEN